MTERGRRRLRRDRTTLSIGPSEVRWNGTALEVRFDETTVPLPSRLRGRVRVEPGALVSRSYALDTAGRHHWRPLAPCARVQVALEQPARHWSGRAYLDTNWGDEPLEAAFARWHWSRSAQPDGTTAVLYDVTRRSGEPLSLALRIDPTGSIEPFAPPPCTELPTTLWQVGRTTRSDPGSVARVRETLEDSPFYARSVVSASLLGERADAVHESLSLDRFRAGWVRLLLPFRMPRRP
ncbi:MAG: carotenoid 1,2-hydratase [Myxococcota bacterium]|nr:carotenoid 1,2-hydratase [Myxococcota bacterium]